MLVTEARGIKTSCLPGLHRCTSTQPPRWSPATPAGMERRLLYGVLAALAAAFLLGCLLGHAVTPGTPDPPGERVAPADLLERVDTDRIRGFLQELSAAPHLAGGER